MILGHDLRIRSLPAHEGITVNYVGERIGDKVNPDYALPEHSLIDLNAGDKLMADLSLQASITNVTDTFWVDNSYSALWTQPGAPRTYRTSLTYEF